MCGTYYFTVNFCHKWKIILRCNFLVKCSEKVVKAIIDISVKVSHYTISVQ